jgi:signal transduction histidine kinase/DNA-binding response OmpR family regulator
LLATNILAFTAYTLARKKARVLAAKLEAARHRQESDELELTQRSELDILKDEFVSTVSHELRTPLTSIRGALGLLSSGLLANVDPKAQNLLRIALTNTERLIRLINDILDLERMDSGKSVLQVKRCSLQELIYQATETISAMADAAEVKIVISPAASAVLPSVYFDADADRIIQVLTNLLSNAVKFSPAASTVCIEVETPPEALIFRVSDQGRGIPEEQLETIFERFKQVEHADSRERKGTGLGLAICRSIIQHHGGTIWAQRNPVKGVSICVRLPRNQRNYDPTTQIAPERTSAVEKPVLICGDDEAQRLPIVEQLRFRGHSVLEASSSSQAIEIAGTRPAQSPLQAIFLDLHMEDMKGWELLKKLTRDTSTANVPIIILSMRVNGEPHLPGTRVPGPLADTPLFADPLFAELGPALGSERGPGRVLLVEDDQDLAEVVKAGFGRTAVAIDHASTLQRAMALCRDRRPDLIILDLTLPDGDGFSLVEWLRGRPELRSLPLIVYSGREVSGDERAKLRLGPTTFLTKAKVKTPDIEQLVLSMVQYDRMGPAHETGSFGGSARASSGVSVA